MSKNVYLDTDEYGRFWVREILPDEAVPIADWYNEEFASHCIEAPDSVKQNLLYDPKTNTFYEWCSVEEDPIFQDSDNIKKLISDQINQI